MAVEFVHFRDPDLSLWQSAVDQVLTTSAGRANIVSRPGMSHPMMSAAVALPAQIRNTEHSTDVATPAMLPHGMADTVQFCSCTAFLLAKAIIDGNAAEEARFRSELTATMGRCDPSWLEVAEVYAAHKLALKPIPYVRHNLLSDFTMDDVLKDNSRIALLGDWGTGDQNAKVLLSKIAEKNPDVVIHLGDVYYSGTQYEFENYFYKIWLQTFKLPNVPPGSSPLERTSPATFALAGNHDMYAGGDPYYTTIKRLGQPASYFCLRGNNWQFIALDTGLHDCDPLCESMPTFLEDQEVVWLKDKIANAGDRKTILLSHHQLFSAFEDIGPKQNRVNESLKNQLESVFPDITAWFWGHEHNLIIYGRHQGILARCIGHGAIPEMVEEVSQRDISIPVENVSLAPDHDRAFFLHGYVLMELSADEAAVSYYQFDPETKMESVLFQERLGAPAVGKAAV